MMRLSLALVALACCAGTLAAQQHPESAEQGEHALRASQVPAAVRDAFRRAYPHATVRGYTTETENGRTIFEVESREGALGRDVSYGADGTVLEVEETVPVAQLPPAVRSAITAQAGTATIRRSERNVTGSDTTYEFAIHGRRGEIRLRADGTSLPPESNE